MRIVWNEQSIRWFEDASRFTGYHEKLAKILLENIPVSGTVKVVSTTASKTYQYNHP